MIAGGLVAAFLGVKAEGQSLENIAKPLTAEEDTTPGADPGPRRSPPDRRHVSHPAPDESRWDGHRLLRNVYG